MILGIDFKDHRNSAVFQYEGKADGLVKWELAAVDTEPQMLNENLDATKSRRNNAVDKWFIDDEVCHLLKEGIIEPFNSCNW